MKRRTRASLVMSENKEMKLRISFLEEQMGDGMNAAIESQASQVHVKSM